MKKFITLIFINLIAIGLISTFCINNYSYADEEAQDFAYGLDMEKTFSGETGKDPEGKIQEGANKAQNAAKKVIAVFIVVFRIVGNGLAIIMLTIIGSKLVLGSVEQKAEAKKHLVPYVIGAIVVFSATTLLALVQEFLAGNI